MPAFQGPETAGPPRTGTAPAGTAPAGTAPAGPATSGTARTATTGAAIGVRGLTKRFGSVLAVDQLSFDVRPGTVTGFLGPNGAGKTTALRMLLGLIRPDSGTATINGRPYRELAQPLHQVGAVLEATGCHPGRTARAHLRVQAAAGHTDPARVDEVLAQVELTSAAGRRVGGFSLGMRQRLGLATALLTRPQVLILDEPANGLDPEGVRWLRDLLRGLAADGRTVLVSSHLLAEMAQTVDDVVIVNRGRLITQAPLAELTSGGQNLEEMFLSLTTGPAARPQATMTEATR
jgi:ABC-2 type transport system ATP-binding protein